MNRVMQRTTAVLMLAALVAAAFFCVPKTARADFDYTSIPTPKVLVMDAKDGTVFFERDADARAFPASTTKIMTCILALENGNLDDAITVGDEVLGTKIKFTQYSSLMGLVSGEQVTLRDLVYGLMLVSGNDAAEAIAVHLGGSIDGFVDLMNQKAQSLGMTNTHFMNPHGVHDENHYTTARDMGKLAAYAIKNPAFVEIAKAVTYTVPASNLRANPLVLNNSNRLIRTTEGDAFSCVYPYAIGLKTGDTTAAGKCLVGAAERDGARAIVVLYGDTAELYGGDAAKTNLARFQNAINIWNDLFDTKYQPMSGTDLNLQSQFDLDVSGANPEDLTGGKLPVTVDTSGAALRVTEAQMNSYRARAAEIQANVRLVGDLAAPIEPGTYLGAVDYELDGTVLYSADLIAPKQVRAATQIQVVAPETPAQPAVSPADTPLLSRPPIEPSTVFGLLIAVLIVLLIALIVVFAINEKKRRKRSQRRRSVQRRR